MMLKLIEKTGFKVIDIYQPINIRDSRGILFYSTESLVPKTKEFNLPIGNYLVDDFKNFKPLKKPVVYQLKSLPRKERNFDKPDDFTISFENNPNKCTIYWPEKKIVFDKYLIDLPLPQLFFILYHEFGHARYETEKFADAYAVNEMLKVGYNPSQVYAAPILALSDAQQLRKQYILNKFL